MKEKATHGKDFIVEYEHLVLVKKNHRDLLLSIPGVRGVGVGYKLVDDVSSDRLSIRVYVTEKQPLCSLAVNSRVPSELDGVATDVIEVGEVHSLAYTSTERPALGGASLGTSISNDTGTFGARFIDNTDGTTVILSNNHVISLADDVVRNAAVVGTPVIQPGQIDGGAIADKVAELKRWVKFVFPPLWNRVDVAIAEIIGPLKASARIHDVGRYSGWRSVYASDIGVTVQKVGRTTELTQGTIDDVAYDTSEDFGYGTAQFGDQIRVVGMSNAGGDSGAMLLDLQGRLLGVVWAGSVLDAVVACPIGVVLSELNISVCPRC